MLSKIYSNDTENKKKKYHLEIATVNLLANILPKLPTSLNV